MGPAAWFRRAEPEQSGVIRKDGDLTRVSRLFSGAADAGIQDLRRGSAGVVTFDPTLSRALLLAEQEEPLLQHLQRGGFWAIPIVLFGLFASIAPTSRRNVVPPAHPGPGARRAHAVRARARRGCRSSLTAQVRGRKASWSASRSPHKRTRERDDRLHATFSSSGFGSSAGLVRLRSTASVSPLLGLLGTVSGMITTFKAMSLFGAGRCERRFGGVGRH